MKKTFKILGLTILTIDTYEKPEDAPRGLLGALRKPQGAILEYTPEQEEKDRERETLRKMEGKE